MYQISIYQKKTIYLFFIATLPLKRTRLDGTYIYIYQQGGSGNPVYTIDCKYSPDVYFLNTTIVFFVVDPPWVLGVTYFIHMTEGVATADYYCGTEAGSFYGTMFGKKMYNIY
jgi:hypothetical protein